MSAAVLDSEITRLATLLNSIQRGGLAVAICDDPELRSELMTEFRSQLRRPLHEIILSGRDDDLLALLNANRVAPHDVVCLFELENLPDEALTRLEWRREAVWELEVGLLLWVTGEGQRRLLEKAPNFYSRRTMLAQFTSAGVAIVTLVAVDVIGSSKADAALKPAVSRILQASARRFRGETLSATGDGAIVEFEDPRNAAEFALNMIGRGEFIPSSVRGALKEMRLSLHSGTVVRLGQGRAGAALSRLNSLLELAQPGQILLSAETRQALLRVGPEKVRWRIFRHGMIKLRKGGVVEAYELTPPGRTPRPLRAVVIPSNLPTRREGFVNRGLELHAIANSLVEKVPIILLGSGGIGKTALALEAAHSALGAGRFAGGVFLMGLPEYSSPESFWIALAGVLDFSSALSSRAHVHRYLRKHPTLLVLDGISEARPNFRGCLEQLARESVLIITSRITVQLFAARTLEIGPLPRAEAIELFRRRLAVGSRHDLRPRQDVIEELIAFSKGNPLVIELIAAQGSKLSPDELLTQLRQQEITPPAQTLGRSLQYFIARLSERDKELLAVLTLFPGGFTEEAAARVAHVDEIEEPFEAFQRAGLIGAATQNGTKRFRLHEIVRGIAAEQRSAQEWDAARERFVAYYHALTETWIAELGAEEEQNFAAALEYAELLRQWREAADFGGFLAMYWLSRRQPAKAEEFAQRAISAARSTDHPHAIVNALHVAAKVALALGKLTQGENALSECLRKVRDLDEPLSEAEVLLTFARLELARSRTNDAREKFERAREIYQRLGHPAGEVSAVSGLAEVAYRELRFEDALDLGEHALHSIRSLGDRLSEARLLTTLGSLLSDTGRVKEAERYYNEAQRIFSELDETKDLGRVLHLHARARKKLGDHQGAERLARQALASFEAGDVPSDASDVRYFLSELETEL